MTETTNKDKLQDAETVESTPQLSKSDLTESDKISEYKRQKRPEIPEGMSKSAWKKLERRKRWAETHELHKEAKRQKRKINRAERKVKIQQAIENGEDVGEILPSTIRKKKPESQNITGCKVILDCSFDDMMLDKEIVSLSNQITRSYSENKRNLNRVDLVVTDFGKRLKERYETRVSAFKDWSTDYITFKESSMEDELPLNDPEAMSKVIYLSADTTDVLEELVEGETYIVGGIVDKGRYKSLCKDKAEKLGIKTKRLPIDEFIKLSGRRVLATSHVIELLLKWFETKDWKESFESVIPSRKFQNENGESTNTPESADVVEIFGEDNEPTEATTEGKKSVEATAEVTGEDKDPAEATGEDNN